MASFRFPTDWKSHLDRDDRLVSAVVSNRVLHAFRLEANGNWDSTYQPFELAGLRPGALLLSALDGEDRLLLAGDTLTNGFGGILRLKAAGGLDPGFGPPPLVLSRISAIAAAPSGRPAVIAGGPPRPLWLSVDGRTVEGAVSLPPLPGGLGANSVRGLVFDQRERLYLTLQLDLGTCAAYRLTSDREWDRGFVVTGQGNFVTSALSHDGDWLYVAGATEVNGMRSGGLVRVSTLARPRIEIVGSSPFFGTELLLAGEAGRRHRVETSRDLRSWEAFVDLTLGEQPEWLTDWIGWGEPYRFYRLSLTAESLRAESDVAGPELDR